MIRQNYDLALQMPLWCAMCRFCNTDIFSIWLKLTDETKGQALSDEFKLCWSNYKTSRRFWVFLNCL